MIDLTNPAHVLLVSLIAILLMVFGACVKDDTKDIPQIVGMCLFVICIVVAIGAAGTLIYQNL